MPIERLRMRPWLENALNEHKYPGVEWVDKERKIFRLPWKHASRNGWKIQTDASLFRAWAEHTGKYKSNDKPNPKTWKANFRCALNSLPDMEELIDRRTTKGNNAFKMYRIMNNIERKNNSSKKMKGRHQRKKRSFSKARNVQKDSQIEKTDTDTDMEQDDEFYQNSSRRNMKTEYQCNIPQVQKNGTHLVDHDYAVTKYFDIFDNESADDDMQEVFDVPDSAIVKTEPLSPKDIESDEEFSLYEESGVDSKNFKTSFKKEEKKILSDDEVVKLIDELSSDCSSPSDSVSAAMDELLDRCISDTTFDTDFSDAAKQRASSAPGMLETHLDTLAIFCPPPSNLPRNKSSTDIQAMLTTTSQELLQSCLA